MSREPPGFRTIALPASTVGAAVDIRHITVGRNGRSEGGMELNAIGSMARKVAVIGIVTVGIQAAAAPSSTGQRRLPEYQQLTSIRRWHDVSNPEVSWRGGRWERRIWSCRWWGSGARGSATT